MRLDQAGHRSAEHHESRARSCGCRARRGEGDAELSKFFIAVGSLVIAVLFTALIGPYLRRLDGLSREPSSARPRPISAGRSTIAGKAERAPAADAGPELHRYPHRRRGRRPTWRWSGSAPRSSWRRCSRARSASSRWRSSGRTSASTSRRSAAARRAENALARRSRAHLAGAARDRRRHRARSTTAAPAGSWEAEEIDAVVEAELAARPRPARREASASTASRSTSAPLSAASERRLRRREGHRELSPIYPVTLAADGALTVGRRRAAFLRGRRHSGRRAAGGGLRAALALGGFPGERRLRARSDRSSSSTRRRSPMARWSGR